MKSETSDDDGLIRSEIEMLMSERESLLRTVGAASVFFANLEADHLPDQALDAADILAKCLDALPESSLREALELVRPLVEKDLGRDGDTPPPG